MLDDFVQFRLICRSRDCKPPDKQISVAFLRDVFVVGKRHQNFVLTGVQPHFVNIVVCVHFALHVERAHHLAVNSKFHLRKFFAELIRLRTDIDFIFTVQRSIVVRPDIGSAGDGHKPALLSNLRF